MNLQPQLENDLVLLRPLTVDDFYPLYQVAKDPLIWVQHPCHDRYKKEEYSKFFKDSIESGGALVVINQSDGAIIGSSRFHAIKDVDNAIEIGWSFLAREFWGGTFNKAVKTLMIDHAFENANDVVFYIGKDNIRSQKAVEKIGGVRVTDGDATYGHLARKAPDDWTYLICSTI